MSTLAIIPSYVRTPADRELLVECIRTLRKTAPECDVLVVDDHSPNPELVEGLDARLYVKPENEGFAHTVNIGLQEALEARQNAVLVNADIEFIEPWLESFEACDADVAGALLLYPIGTIQHAGVFFSRLHRCFDHRYRHGPGDLPEAQEPFDCPVTGALQFIRYETLAEVGLYDETFRMGWEDVDYCLRTFAAGRRCHYLPTVRAYHHESVFRGRPSEKVEKWQQHSYLRLYAKWPSSEMLKYAVPVV